MDILYKCNIDCPEFLPSNCGISQVVLLIQKTEMGILLKTGKKRLVEKK